MTSTTALRKNRNPIKSSSFYRSTTDHDCAWSNFNVANNSSGKSSHQPVCRIMFWMINRRMEFGSTRWRWQARKKLENLSLITSLCRPYLTLFLHPCWRGKVNWRVFGQVMDRFTLRIRTAAEDRT
jgi:hypothetical protein